MYDDILGKEIKKEKNITKKAIKGIKKAIEKTIQRNTIDLGDVSEKPEKDDCDSLKGCCDCKDNEKDDCNDSCGSCSNNCDCGC